MVLRFLEEPEYAFMFQPLIALTSGQVVGYEILSRPRKAGQPLDVEAFFTQAHRQGLAVLVDRILLEKVADIIPTLGQNAPSFFINVDPDSIEDPEIHARLSRLGPHGVLEVTERGDWDASRHDRIFNSWRSQGGLIALDDFGSGYSGLEKLVVMGPDYVKLDHRLIRGCDTASAQQNIIRAMGQLAVMLGFQLLGEGIETESEMTTCMDLGVTLGQGYYLGRPQPWDDLVPMTRAIREQIITYRTEASAMPLAQGLDAWGHHNALMERILAASQDTSRVFHIVQTLYATLHPYSVSCLVARDSGLYPILSLGHAHRKPILWEEPSLAHKAFLGSGIQVVQRASDHAIHLGSLNLLLDRPESVAIAPVGRPPWGVLGADFQKPYAWRTPRIEVLKTLSNLMTLLFPKPPQVLEEDDV